MTNSQKLARIFKLMSVDTRVRMIRLLKRRSLCVNALARVLELTPAAVSQHLRLLRDADLVVPERRGYFIHYRLNERTLAKWETAAAKLLSVEEPKAPSASAKAYKRKETGHV
jgi:DNA-binding transcriptional ArsR family regulator